MTLPGLALFYGGLVRRKNVLSILASCLGVTGLVTLLWWLVVSQLLTLCITPVIYLWLAWFQEHVLDRVPFLRSAHFHEYELTPRPETGHSVPVTTS